MKTALELAGCAILGAGTVSILALCYQIAVGRGG